MSACGGSSSRRASSRPTTSRAPSPSPPGPRASPRRAGAPADARSQRGRSLSSTAASPAQAGGNVYDKYGTANPIERRLVTGFIRQLLELVDLTGAVDAHEVGCGEGELARRLAARGLRVRGTDASAEVIAEARARAEAAGVAGGVPGRGGGGAGARRGRAPS